MKLIPIMAFSVATLFLAGCQSATSSSGSSGPTIATTATALAGTWTEVYAKSYPAYNFDETDVYTFTLDSGSTTGGSFVSSQVKTETTIADSTKSSDYYYAKGTWSVADEVLTLTETSYSLDNTSWHVESYTTTKPFLVVDNTFYQDYVFTAQGTVSGLVGTWSQSTTYGIYSDVIVMTFNSDKTSVTNTYEDGDTVPIETQAGVWSVLGTNLTVTYTSGGETASDTTPYAIYGTKLVLGDGYTKGTTAKAVTRSVAPFNAQRHLTK